MAELHPLGVGAHLWAPYGQVQLDFTQSTHTGGGPVSWPIASRMQFANAVRTRALISANLRSWELTLKKLPLNEASWPLRCTRPQVSATTQHAKFPRGRNCVPKIQIIPERKLAPGQGEALV